MDAQLYADTVARARDLCEGCGGRLYGQGALHHRQAKGMGGTGKKGSHDYPGNLLVLHTTCHTWAHAHPTDARRLGWIVPSWTDPTTVPVTRYRP